MNVEVCVNRNHKFQSFYKAALDEYSKRLTPYLTVSLYTGTLKKYKNPKKDTRFVLAGKTGVSLSSEAAAGLFSKFAASGASGLVFFIGFQEGELLGITGECRKYALTGAGISPPLEAVLLYEQLYRIMKINNNEPYHK